MIHPTVAFYQCPNDKCPCKNSIVKEEFIHITSDKSHDDQAVSQFIEKTLEHLKAKGIKIDDIQEFTDQCANQYKSKNNFYTISKSKIPVTRHFFAIKHGKGPSDHAGAHYKNWVKCIMRDPHLFITSCRDLAEYSILHYSKQVKCNGENAKDAHSLRFVIYHPEIYRMESKGKNLKTIKDT